MNYAPELPVSGDIRLGDLSGFEENFDISTEGMKVAQFFESHPDMPGVIITREGKFECAIAQHDFLRAIGHQFGSAVFYRRPIQAVIDYLHGKPMVVLPSHFTILKAMELCLARDPHGTFDAFIVENKSTGVVKMVDFRTLMLASCSVLDSLNQQLAREIQERKVLEYELLRAQRLETVGLLAGGVAHNLNNILSPILMVSSMLTPGLPAPIHQEYVHILGESAKRAADIVKQLLSFSSGLGVGAQQGTFSPQRLIEDVERFTRMTFPSSISLATRYGEDLDNITGNQSRLHEVLLNLCINSKHAMPGGGQINISAENCDLCEGDEVLPMNVRPGRYIKISVADTGCGIAAENIEKVFDPFFTTKEAGKGTGLGLSTAVGIVRSHGGFMKVSSKPGQGAIFSVFLPATIKPVDATAHCPSTEIQPRGEGEVILVVDDENHILEMAEAVLKTNGYEVLTAKNGYEAFATFDNQGQRVDVVLTDITMPGMNGVELAQLLKQKDPSTKIILSSGRIDHSDDSALQKLGLHARLCKPYRAEQLLRVVHEKIHLHIAGTAPIFSCLPIS